MYGASGKMGRGAKRNIHAPPIGRPNPAGRMSLGGAPRGRGGAFSAAASSPSTSSLQVEESFSLVRENPLNFGMAIKLAPDLVEEIKRVEAQGGTARIKFGAIASGNVIHVGDKTFKFTWSREPGDSCDIYEERRSGDGGNGVLVESGGTWRKLNVERELDESTKNHVKRRSEEAERKHNSRQSIVLDHQSPSMRNQMKAIAASESNQWRNFKNRNEPPFKKQKSETTSGGPPKSAYKPVSHTTNLLKGRLSAGSPLSFQQEQLGPSTSPVGSGDLLKGHTAASDFSATQNFNNVSSSEKNTANRRNSNISEKSKHNRSVEVKPSNLRSMIISQLMEHQSTGMSLKALEKAIGDAIPNSTQKIEPVLKLIANYQAPGRYVLKPGIEMEGFKKLPLSGRSPEINLDRSPIPQKFDQLPTQDPSIPMRTAANDEEPGELNSTPIHATDIIENIDSIMKSPENLSDRNIPNNSEGMAGSSTDSGSGSDSDSETDTSESGTDSGSNRKSKSQSPVGSPSGSSSSSDTDASSNSKQASDEDVDIMTSDDDKESKLKLQYPNTAASRNPVLWSNLDNEDVDIGNYENQDHHVSDVIEIDIEKDSPEGDHHAEMRTSNHLFANKEGEEPIVKVKSSPANHYEQQERQSSEKKMYDDGSGNVVNGGFKHGHSGTQGRTSKNNYKRCFDDKHSDERTPSKKRLKGKNSIEPVAGTINSLFGESPYNSSPDRPLQSPEKEPVDVMEDRTTRDDTDYPDLQSPSRAKFRPVSNSQQPAKRSSEAVVTDNPTGEKRSGKHNSMDRDVQYSERSFQINEGLEMQKRFTTQAQSEDGLVNERRQSKSVGLGDKHTPIVDPHNKRPEMTGKVEEPGTSSKSYRGYSPKDTNPNTADRPPVMNGRSGLLQREHSELELGEFREPFPEEIPATKKQFERKSSSKHLENKQMDAEYWNSDFSGGKPSNKIPSGLEKLSSPNSEAVNSSIPDGPYKRKNQNSYVDNRTKSHQRSTQPVDLHHRPRGDFNIQQNTIPEMSDKCRFDEAGAGQCANIAACGETFRKIPANSTEQQRDPFRGVGVDPRATKPSKKQKPKMTGVSNDRRLDVLAGTSRQKKKLSSLDKTCSSFTKFEKEEPELKGPIRDISQYKECVKEYQEKYESYSSLNKILESYRDEFSKLGKDLEAYRGRDMKKYNVILEQIRSSFRQCGEKHKRLKKIFVVLYEELKHLKRMIKDYAATSKKD